MVYSLLRGLQEELEERSMKYVCMCMKACVCVRACVWGPFPTRPQHHSALCASGAVNMQFLLWKFFCAPYINFHSFVHSFIHSFVHSFIHFVHSGQDVLLCGFTSVLYTGVICASQVLHRNVWNDFTKIENSIRKEQAAKKADWGNAFFFLFFLFSFLSGHRLKQDSKTVSEGSPWYDLCGWLGRKTSRSQSISLRKTEIDDKGFYCKRQWQWLSALSRTFQPVHAVVNAQFDLLFPWCLKKYIIVSLFNPVLTLFAFSFSLETGGLCVCQQRKI